MSKSRTLVLPVKQHWFELIRIGRKSEEYRLYNEYWRKRLVEKTFDKVVVTLGYPKRGDAQRRIEFPWRGYRITTITHSEWNNVPQQVFAIKLLK